MNVGQIAKSQFCLLGHVVTYNSETLFMTAIVMSILLGFGCFVAREAKKKLQDRSLVGRCGLWFVGAFFQLCEETLGSKGACRYFPFICTTFLFVLLSNLIGIVPLMKSPTEDLNICLSLAFVCFIVAHGSGVLKKGLWGYLKGYCEPFVFMLPLNIIGEIGQALSHCFRLFGNIFGGGIIFVLVPYVFFKILSSFSLPDISESTLGQILDCSQNQFGSLLLYVVSVPIISSLYCFVYAFFGLFAGTVQALVFMMLALTYVAGQVDED